MRAPTELEHLVIYSDGVDHYAAEIPKYFDTKLVDYDQLIKIRVNGKVVEKIRRVVFGEPFILRVNTNDVENYNGILRASIGYLVRKTKCIAKKARQLEARLQLFQFYWNFLHRLPTGKTPAITEGISRKVWTWGNFLHYKVKLC